MPIKTLINAQEISETLGTSKSHAYKIMKQLNDELKNRGYIIVAGKVSRAYFEEKIYGLKEGSHNANI